MKTLAGLFPWWSWLLLVGNISLSAMVLKLRQWSGTFESLTMLRVYLWHSLLAGIAGAVALFLTPVGSWAYWYTVSTVNFLFVVIFFLLCCQIIVQAIHRKTVELVKTLWLVGCVIILGAIVAINAIYPFLHIRQSLSFDMACALASGAVLLFGILKPTDLRDDEIWMRDYRQIVQGLAVQIVALCAVKFFKFPSVAGEIFAGLASMVTLVIFAGAVSKGSLKQPAMQTAL